MGVNSAQADLAISVVRNAFYDGLRSMDLSPEEAEGVWQSGPSATVSGPWYWNSGQSATLYNLKSMVPHIHRWKDVRRNWAERGTRDDGSSYTWPQWFSEGKTYAGDIGFHTNVHVDASTFVAIKDTVVETVVNVGEGAGNIARGAGEVAMSVGKNVHWLALGIGLFAVAYVARGFVR